MRRLVLLLIILSGLTIPITAQEQFNSTCRNDYIADWNRNMGQVVLLDSTSGEVETIVTTGLPQDILFDKLEFSANCTYITGFISSNGGDTWTFNAWTLYGGLTAPTFTVSPISPFHINWSPDDRYVLLRRSLTEDVIVDASSGNVIGTIPAQTPPRLVAWATTSGRIMIARANVDDLVDVYDLSGNLLSTIDTGFYTVIRVSVNPAGTAIAITNHQNNPIFDLTTFEQIGELEDAGNVRFESDTLVVGVGGRSFDLIAGRRVYIPDEVSAFNPADYTRDPSHPYVVIRNTAYEVYMGNMDTGEVRRMNVYAPMLDALRFTENRGLYVPANCAERTQHHAFDISRNRLLVVPNALCQDAVVEFDLSSGEPTQIYQAPLPTDQTRLGFVVSPDRNWLVVYNYPEGRAIKTMWVVPRGSNTFRELPVFNGASANLSDAQFAFSPDGTRFARGSEKVTVYDLASATVITESEGPHSLVRELRFVDDATLETTNNYNGGIELWDINTGEAR